MTKPKEHFPSRDIVFNLCQYICAAAVAQWVRAIALQAEGCVFESQLRRT